MNNKVAKNYVYNLLYQLLIIILPIITTPYLSRVLGAENIGIYGYTLSIVTYFSIVGALGISKYAQREIAYVQDNLEQRSKVFWEINFIKMITISISIIVFIIAFCISGKFVIYYRILLLELIAIYFDISWFYQGMENFKNITIRNLMMRLIGVIMIFTFVKDSSDLSNYILIYVFTNLFGNILLWINISKYIKFIIPHKKDLIIHIKPILSLFIPQIATSVYTILDKTMLGFIIKNMAEVGFYEQSQKIIKIALISVTSLSVVMMPRISNNNSKGNKTEITRLMKNSFTFDYLLGFAIMFGIMGISKNFVPWFFGNEYLKVSILLLITSPIIIFISLSTTIGNQYFVSLKKQRVQTISVIIGALLNILFNFILIPHFYSIGAAISTIIAECTISLIEIIFLVKKENYKIKDIFPGFFNYFISGIVMFLFVYLTGLFLKANFINTILQIIEGIIIYTIMLFILKDKFTMQLLNKFTKREKQKMIK